MSHLILIFRMAGATPRLALQALAPQLVIALHTRTAAIGFILMMNAVVSITTILLYPIFTKWVSIDRMLAVGAVLSAIGMLSIALSHSFSIIAVMFCVAGGIGWTFLGLQCPQHLVANLPSSELVANIRSLSAGPLVAGLLVPPGLVWVSQYASWHVMTVCLSLLLLAMCLACISRLPSGIGLLVHRSPDAIPVIPPARIEVGIVEYAAILVSGTIAGFFSLHFVFIVKESFGNALITATALFVAGIISLASVFAFAHWQAMGRLFRNLTLLSTVASVGGLLMASVYQTVPGILSLLALPVLSTGYFMHSMSVAAGYDRTARVSGYLMILHMSSAGAGAYLSSLVVQATGSYTCSLLIMSALSLAMSVLLIVEARFQLGSTDYAQSSVNPPETLP